MGPTGDGGRAGKHKQAVLGMEEDLWALNFCRIGGGLRAPKAFRNVGATPAPTTPLLKPQGDFNAGEHCQAALNVGPAQNVYKVKNSPKKRESPWPPLLVLCREHVELILPGAGRQRRSREGATAATSLLRARGGASGCSQVVPVLPAESGQIPSLPFPARHGSPWAGWGGELCWQAQHSPGIPC